MEGAVRRRGHMPQSTTDRVLRLAEFGLLLLRGFGGCARLSRGVFEKYDDVEGMGSEIPIKFVE